MNLFFPYRFPKEQITGVYTLASLKKLFLPPHPQKIHSSLHPSTIKISQRVFWWCVKKYFLIAILGVLILRPSLLVMALLPQWLPVTLVSEQSLFSAVQNDVISLLHPVIHPSTIKIFQMVKMGHGIKFFIKCAMLVESILPV